jgi:DNA mismatch repair protein MutS
LDAFTIRNLELIRPAQERGTALVDVIDATQNPMGARMLRRWIMMPLRDVEDIQNRLDAVEQWIKEESSLANFRNDLKELGDWERMAARMAVQKITPRELVQLSRSLEIVIKWEQGSEWIKSKWSQLKDLSGLQTLLKRSLHDDAPHTVGKGMTIASGIHSELDELRDLQNSGKEKLKEIEEREMERTGISSLKISFNNVFGYYLEVRNTHKDKVPVDWIRKQTLTQAERYITEELKEYESKILGAEEKILSIEQELFSTLVQDCLKYLVDIQYNSRQLAKHDVLCSFAHTAIQNGYVKPVIEDSNILQIEEGRHPVIEKLLPIGDQYISNNVALNPTMCQIMMITGPNMSGKSALLRQTALITLMAQMGSFVPAKAARIGCVDRIFTRVGASDNLSAGESTFMVEMNETASILNQMTGRSLILLDEIGRGTSTYDGISIAWAIAEFLHQHPLHQPKTLFATHYHELNEMTHQFPRIQNFNVSVREEKGKIIFLRKLSQGGSNHSFGIHVAQLAGMPKAVTNRAAELLMQLESQRGESKTQMQIEGNKQLAIFEMQDPQWSKVKHQIKMLEVNQMTPIEALQFIANLQQEANRD